jgi:hypothetical protein
MIKQSSLAVEKSLVRFLNCILALKKPDPKIFWKMTILTVRFSDHDCNIITSSLIIKTI